MQMSYRQGGNRTQTQDYMAYSYKASSNIERSPKNDLNFKKLFIHNIDYKTSYDEIYREFARIGKLRY